MNAIRTTENMPMMVTSAKLCNAGCLANINEPIPMNIIRAEMMMELLYEANNFLR